MTRVLFKILARLSPAMADLARQSYYTMKGWRIDELKRHIENKPPYSTLTLDYTLRAAFDQKTSGERVAFISCLPPMKSGVATYSLYSWLNYSGPLDIFTPVIDDDWFFATARLLRGDGSGPRLFNVAGFLSMDQAASYSSIVVAIGNSNHHLYIFDLLNKLQMFSTLERVTFLVHDPCLLNLVQSGSELAPPQFQEILAKLYEQSLPKSSSQGLSRHELIAEGILGVRYFYNRGVKHYLVNSAAAKILVESDLRGTGALIRQVFNPVFSPINMNKDDRPSLPTDRLVVGTYGVPSFDKGIQTIADAIRILMKRGENVSLVLSGFNAARFVQWHETIFAGIEMEIIESPPDADFARSMQKCHVAVQLREYQLGESSGVVPQLLTLDKDVIVTAAGSFVEYGDAVRQVPTGISPERLADEILVLKTTPIAAENKRAYVETHSPERFQSRFAQLFMKPAAPRRTPSLVAVEKS